MNSTIYRKVVLVENWADNQFIMIKKKVNVPRCLPCPYSINFQRTHPMVLTEEAFWVSHNELCLFGFVRKKELPMDCVKIILSFINDTL